MPEGIKLKLLKYAGYKQLNTNEPPQCSSSSTADITDDRESTSSNSSSSDNRDMFSSTYWFGQKEEESTTSSLIPGMSKSQRVIGFFLLLLIGIFCFGMAGLCTPFLVLKIRKFVLLYSMGSLFTIGSFAMLWGPMTHLKHIFSYGRLPFTLAYFGTMFGTLYSALVMKSTSITLIFATLQIVSLAWYIFSYIPGGTTGMKFFSKLFASFCAKTVTKSLPI